MLRAASVQCVLVLLRSNLHLQQPFRSKHPEPGSLPGLSTLHLLLHLLTCRWAGGLEDKYFARLAKGAIKIYETPEMTQLDKKDLKLEGVQVRDGLLLSVRELQLVCLIFD